MRPELEELIRTTLLGVDDSAMVLKSLLEHCLGLVAASADQWEGQGAERNWPDFVVENVAPELAFFLPTPSEFEEAKRRLRLALTSDGQLNRHVMRVSTTWPTIRSSFRWSMCSQATTVTPRATRRSKKT
jgi:hypothetical protein